MNGSSADLVCMPHLVCIELRLINHETRKVELNPSHVGLSGGLLGSDCRRYEGTADSDIRLSRDIINLVRYENLERSRERTEHMSQSDDVKKAIPRLVLRDLTELLKTRSNTES